MILHQNLTPFNSLQRSSVVEEEAPKISDQDLQNEWKEFKKEDCD